MPKECKDLVVYLYDEKHVKQYIHGNRSRTWVDTNPKKARVFNHKDAVRLLARHGLVNGGGFELHTHAYADYVVNNDVPLDQI